MFSFLEGPDLIIVVIVVVLLFGGSQLPKLAKNLGEAQRELKKGLAGSSPKTSDSTSDKASGEQSPSTPQDHDVST